MNSIISRNNIKKVIIVLFWILLWQVVYCLVNQPLLIPSPFATVNALFTIVFQASTWQTIGLTAVKILVGYMLAIVLGLVFAAAAHFCNVFAEWFSPIITLMKSVPVACFIVVVLAWLSSAHVSVFIAFFVVFPLAYTQFYTGFSRMNQDIWDMCKVFAVSSRKKVQYIYIPYLLELLPGVFAATIGMAVRAAVAAELIGIPGRSIGKAIYKAKQYFDIAELFAWTILIILLCFCMEKAFIQLVRFLKRSYYDRSTKYIQKL